MKRKQRRMWTELPASDQGETLNYPLRWYPIDTFQPVLSPFLSILPQPFFPHYHPSQLNFRKDIKRCFEKAKECTSENPSVLRKVKREETFDESEQRRSVCFWVSWKVGRVQSGLFAAFIMGEFAMNLHNCIKKKKRSCFKTDDNLQVIQHLRLVFNHQLYR